jgi:hypothetical protein|mmetsp:Transcript_31206/g.70548  ORF Transcript_31206/g.70548 Transcript_31206/m.70548 type:complete len:88 (-) Transcript_31206:326-589(-)
MTTPSCRAYPSLACTQKLRLALCCSQAHAQGMLAWSRRTRKVEGVAAALAGRKHADAALFWNRLQVMVFENGLFVAFVVGMTSGLPS